jgi:serine protease inhibitor
MRRWLTPCLSVLLIACACGQASTPVIPVQRVSMSITDSSSGFGLALLDRLLAEPGAGNVFISPLSATIALSMAASAAQGDTRAAILRVLGVDPNANADEQARQTIERLAQSDDNAQLELAQAVWAQNGLKLNPAYTQRLRTDYQAQLANLDFSSPDAPTVVNHWVDSKTHHKISKLVDQFDIGTVGYLVNATYFHALWATQFKAMSSPVQFQEFSGSVVSPAMMHRDDDVIEYQSPSYAAALLPYKGGRFSAVVILPSYVLSPARFASFLTPDLWTSTLRAFHSAAGDTFNARCKPSGDGSVSVSCDGTLQMPKFNLDYHKDLTKTLGAMGMPIPGGAVPDFCTGCFISSVVQATRLEVDEKGTTAAAATGVDVVLALRMPMVVDRPFAFGLIDNATGAPLFLGAIGTLT